MKGALVGKVGSVFTGSGTQHGGQELTILAMIPTLLHQGMIVVGLPYSFQGQSTMDEITGCSPYGASTITKPDGSRMPSENELEARAFKAATSRRSLANSKHDLTFGAGTDGFRSSEPPITSDEVAMPDACRAGRGAKC